MQWTGFFNTASLERHASSGAVKRILAAALDAANPADAVRGELTRTQSLLRFNGQAYPLNGFSAIYLVSVGKAAVPMAEAVTEILGDFLSKGIVVYKENSQETSLRGAPFRDEANSIVTEKFTFIASSHPVPDTRSLAAGEKILELLAQATADDLVIFLISGGGSALITAPVDGFSLADFGVLTNLLLGCGARIDEINTLRRALDRVKGGGLAHAAAPAQTISLLLSDVVNSPLEAIASGPTVANPTSRADALAVLKKYGLLHQVPAPILDALKDEKFPKPEKFWGDALIIGSNAISAQAAKNQAKKEGFVAEILTTALEGEAAEVGHELGKMLRQQDFTQYALHNVERPFCLILGGETTVMLGDANGRGGRNQEVALAAVRELAEVPNVMLVTLATDGDDGPTDAAGAVVTGATLARARRLGLDVDAHLRWHNAYPFFDALGDLLKPGLTGTNVNDLTFLFGF